MTSIDACDSFFAKSNSDLCEILYNATNGILFSAPSLGLVQKGFQNKIPLPVCPALKFFIPIVGMEEISNFNNPFFRTLHNRTIHEWEAGEEELYQQAATSKVKFITKQLGFQESIEISPENVDECAQLGEVRHVSVGWRIRACKPFYRDLIGLNGLEREKEAEGIVAHELGHIALPRIEGDAIREEIKADLYSLRNARFARGGRDALVRVEKIVPLEFEIPYRGPSPNHPYTFERIAYMTEGLCALYPEQNRDIC
jgi:hypothetical protein